MKKFKIIRHGISLSNSQMDEIYGGDNTDVCTNKVEVNCRSNMGLCFNQYVPVDGNPDDTLGDDSTTNNLCVNNPQGYK